MSIYRLSTAEYLESAPPILRFGTVSTLAPVSFVATVLFVALPHVGLDRVENVGVRVTALVPV